jgi:hypothetical protein
MKPKKPAHPLMKRGAKITDETHVWLLKNHLHEVIGAHRGFEVRVYNYPTKYFPPYLVALISQPHGWIMDADNAATESEARASGLNLLMSLVEHETRH